MAASAYDAMYATLAGSGRKLERVNPNCPTAWRGAQHQRGPCDSEKKINRYRTSHSPPFHDPHPLITFCSPKMLSSQRINGGNSRPIHDDDDSEDEALASALAGALQDDEVYDDLESRAGTATISGDDIQQRLATAAQPLEFQATLGARFASYDNYCSLFHFILNSDGPVDLELPTVSDCGTLLRHFCGLGLGFGGGSWLIVGRK